MSGSIGHDFVQPDNSRDERITARGPHSGKGEGGWIFTSAARLLRTLAFLFVFAIALPALALTVTHDSSERCNCSGTFALGTGGGALVGGV